MDFMWGLLKVIVGAFLLFTIASIAYRRMLPKAGWQWVALVSILAIANMLFHRMIGSSINPPFYTAIQFAISLMGFAPNHTVIDGKTWIKRGITAIGVGTFIGYLSFSSISNV